MISGKLCRKLSKIRKKSQKFSFKKNRTDNHKKSLKIFFRFLLIFKNFAIKFTKNYCFSKNNFNHIKNYLISVPSLNKCFVRNNSKFFFKIIPYYNIHYFSPSIYFYQPFWWSARRQLIVYVSLCVQNDSEFFEFGERLAVAQYAGDIIAYILHNTFKSNGTVVALVIRKALNELTFPFCCSCFFLFWVNEWGMVNENERMNTMIEDI